MKRYSRFSQMFSYVGPVGDDAGLDDLNGAIWQPLVDVYEHDATLLIVVEIPGIDQKTLEVSIQEGVLSVSGNRPERKRSATERIHQMEIAHGRFARRVKLPDCVDVDHIDATYSDGYLTIEIPRIGTNG